MESQQILRVGMLGTGAWSRLHLYNLQRQPHVEVCACYGSNPQKTQTFQQQAGEGCVIYPRYQDMFPHIDAMYVVIPPFAHDMEIIEAAEAGIHVFTEKPIARTLEQSRRIVEQVNRYPAVKTQIGFMLRFSRVVEVVQDFVFRRGRPVLFIGRYFSNDLHAHWWRDIEKSGGQLLEQVIHLVDIACHFCGEPERVYFDRANLCHQAVPNYTAGDVSALTIRFENGALAVIGATNQAVPGKWECDFRMVFENLTVAYWEPSRGEFWVTEPGQSEFFQVNEGPDPYLRETEDFLDAIRNEHPPRVPLSEGLKSMRIIDAAEQSLKRGEPVGIVQNLTDTLI